MASFDLGYPETSSNEGGYANVKGDTGGETYAGISRKWFPNWEGWKIVDKQKPLYHNQYIKDDNLKKLVKAFYKKEFWDKIGGDKISQQDTANRMYDFAVSAGVTASIKNMQKALGYANADGKLTDKLISDINNPINQLLK